MLEEMCFAATGYVQNGPFIFYELAFLLACEQAETY